MARKSLLEKGREAQAQAKGGNPELRSRLLFVVIGLIMFRLGSYIPVPGVNADVLRAGLRYHALHLCVDYHSITGSD